MGNKYSITHNAIPLFVPFSRSVSWVHTSWCNWSLFTGSRLVPGDIVWDGRSFKAWDVFFLRILIDRWEDAGCTTTEEKGGWQMRNTLNGDCLCKQVLTKIKSSPFLPNTNGSTQGDYISGAILYMCYKYQTNWVQCRKVKGRKRCTEWVEMGPTSPLIQCISETYK
jgi:hypothetical protein